MRRASAFVVLVSLALLPRATQGAGLSGRFVEKGGRTPLAAVEVVLRRSADSTVVAHASTGADGRFRLDSLRLDRYRLRASLLGYESWARAEIALDARAPDLDLGTVALAVAPIAVPGVTTSTARATAIVAPDRNVYLTKDMPAAGAGNTLDLLRAVPELDVDVDDKVSLRGSSGVSIQINGRKSPLQGDALTNFLRQLPAARIERVEVIANPSAKFDPEGAGGIVNIVTREPLDLGWSGSLYLMAGRDQGWGGPRLAWQKGKLTLSGGLSGGASRYLSSYDDLRRNFLTRPPSSYRMHSNSDGRYRSGNADGSFDVSFDRQSTLYGTFSGYASDHETDGTMGYVLADSLEAVTSRYDRASDGSGGWATGTITLGFRHVVHQDRDEWSLEVRQNDSPNNGTDRSRQHLLVPVDSTGVAAVEDQDGSSRERSLQVDGTRPLGTKGKLEAGYRGLERRNLSIDELTVLVGAPGGGRSDYLYREIFHAAYVTAGSTLGRLSAQLGLRAEVASAEFDARTRAARYDHDYRTVYPSANVAWDFGKGRTTRLTYSKRIERPSAWYLDVDSPSLDPLNRMVGNPVLGPKYTHSVSLDASWSGSRGMLRLSPFYRRTVDNWDSFKRVDSLGAATTTWLNASSIRFAGASLVASLRQVKRIGGTLNLSVYRERHDAGNLALSARRTAVNWSATGNLSCEMTKALALQSWVRYTPAQTLAQGHVSAMVWSNVAARVKFGDQAWASLWVNDPFDLYRWKFVTQDATHLQTSENHSNQRRVMLGLGCSWGKPPEQKPRKQADEQPQQDPQPQVH